MLFADLRGWTDFSVTTEPEEVMTVIRSFHAAMGRLIESFEATVGWFAGDGLRVWSYDSGAIGSVLEPVGALTLKGFGKPVEAFAALAVERVVA